MFALIAVCAPVICEPIEVEAVRTEDVVFALMTEASELEAVLTVFVVFAFTADVPALIDEAKEVDADWTSESVAREPAVKVASVRLRVA